MKAALLAFLLFSLEANAMRPNLRPGCLDAIHNLIHESVRQYFPILKDEEINNFICITSETGLNPYRVAKIFYQRQLDIRDVNKRTLQESIPACYTDFIISPYENKNNFIISTIREQRLIGMINSPRIKALSLPAFDIRMMAIYLVMQDYNPYKITNEAIVEAVQHLKLTKALREKLDKYVKEVTNSAELEWADQRAMDELWLLPAIDWLLSSDFELEMPVTDETIDSLKNGILRPNGPLILKVIRNKMQKLSTYCSSTDYELDVRKIFSNAADDDIEMFIALISSINLNPVNVAHSLHKSTSNIAVINEKTIQKAINPRKYADFVYLDSEIGTGEIAAIKSIRECLLLQISDEIEKIIPNISHLEAKLISMYLMINKRYPQLEKITDENLEEAQQFPLLVYSLYRNLALYVQSVTELQKIRPESLMQVQDLEWLLPTIDHLFFYGYQLDTKLTKRIIEALKKKALAVNGKIIRNLTYCDH